MAFAHNGKKLGSERAKDSLDLSHNALLTPKGEGFIKAHAPARRGRAGGGEGRKGQNPLLLTTRVKDQRKKDKNRREAF